MAEVTKTIVPLGLYTDPGPFSAAPDGALVEAQNVTLLRDGLLEPRPGFTLQADSGVSEYDIISHGTYVEDVGEFVWYNSAFSGWTVRRDATDTITGPTDFTHGKINAQYVKGRLLFTSNEGVCEMPQDSGDTIAYRAGLPQPTQIMAYAKADADGWLVDDDLVGYRFVFKRTRSDGTVMRSAPSSIIYVRYSSSSGAYPNAYPIIDGTDFGYTDVLYDVDSTFDTLIDGDELEIYRGPKTNDPTEEEPVDDEMMLRAVVPIVSGAIEPFADNLDDGAWSGAPLYTNSTQEGILQGHYRPNYARDIALYNGMTMLAGQRSPQRIALQLNAIGNTAWSYGTVFGNTSPLVALVAGATTITTGEPFVSGITIGMDVTMDGSIYGSFPGYTDTYFTAGTVVTNVDLATLTITLSKPILATNASIRVTFWDWLEVSDSTGSFKIYGSEAFFSGNEYFFLTEESRRSSTNMYFGGYPSLEYKFNNSSARIKDIRLLCSGLTNRRGITLFFERASFSSDPFTITSTKPLAFDRYVDTVTGVTSAQDGNGSRLTISKTDIPDAYPLLNYIDIGNLSSDIVRVIPAQNTLLVFKEDGIYQVFGNDPSSLSVELLDSTIWPVDTLRSGNWFASLGSNVFMMSSSGPVVVSDISVTPIGAPIMETFREMFGQSFKNLADGDTFYVSAGACPSMPYVMFSYAEQGAQELDPETSLSFVFNTDNGTWTTWTQRRRLSCHWVGQYGRLTAGFGTLDGYAVVGYFDHERDLINQDLTSRTHLLGCDYLENGTMFLDPDSLGGGWYLFTELSSSYHVVNQGDIVVLASSPYDFGVVEEIVSSSSFRACIYDGSISGIPNVFYLKEAFPVRVMFAPATFGEPGIEKQILNTLFAFNLRTLLLRFYAEFQTYRLDSNKEQTTEDLALTTGWTQGITAADKTISIEWAPDLIGLDVPRSVASDWATKVGFNIQQACSWFSLGALVLKANVSTDLVNRGRS